MAGPQVVYIVISSTIPSLMEFYKERGMQVHNSTVLVHSRVLGDYLMGVFGVKA
jgi:hypothetical protein